MNRFFWRRFWTSLHSCSGKCSRIQGNACGMNWASLKCTASLPTAFCSGSHLDFLKGTLLWLEKHVDCLCRAISDFCYCSQCFEEKKYAAREVTTDLLTFLRSVTLKALKPLGQQKSNFFSQRDLECLVIGFFWASMLWCISVLKVLQHFRNELEAFWLFWSSALARWGRENTACTVNGWSDQEKRWDLGGGASCLHLQLLLTVCAALLVQAGHWQLCVCRNTGAALQREHSLHLLPARATWLDETVIRRGAGGRRIWSSGCSSCL